MADFGFDGSSCTFTPADGGAGAQTVSPLTEFRAPDNPATSRVTGADATSHLHRTGRPNKTITIGFLGSNPPDVGNVADIAVTLAAGMAAQNFAAAAITRVSISGRRDGEIRGSVTCRPSVKAKTAFTGWAAGDKSFNGSTFSWNGAPLTGIVSMGYEAAVAEPDSSGAEAAAVQVSPGIPDRTATIELLGPADIDVGDEAATVCAWNDGGTLGSFNAAICVSVEPGAVVDDVVTTRYTFKETTN